MSDCAGCGRSERRDFLRQVAGVVAGILASLHATPAEAVALPLSMANPLRRVADEVTYPEPAADGAMIDLEQEVILVRWQGNLYAFNLSCPHQNTALRWQSSEHLFRCPRHKSEYQPDGTFIRGRATRSMDRFALRKEGANVVVSLDKLFRDDRDHPGWVAATVPT
jgi:Rieske Fe-S protein